jgi:hypothetical protein
LEKAKPETEIVMSLKITAVTGTNVQVSRLP